VISAHFSLGIIGWLVVTDSLSSISHDQLLGIIFINLKIGMKCTCGSSEEIVDENLGDIICAGCSRVKQSRQIVSNVRFSLTQLNFNERSVMGQFGSKNGEYSRIKACRIVTD
jgi:hypothetical protein